MINPCCMPLQRGVRILAVIDAVLNFINLCLIVLALLAVIGLVARSNLSDHEISPGGGAVAIIIVILAGLIRVLHVLLAVMLYTGAKHRIYLRCRNWLIITVVLTVIGLVSFITSSWTRRFDGYNFGTSIFGVIYRLYEIWVVLAFIREMEGESSSTIRRNGGGGVVPSETVIVAYPYQNQEPPQQQFNENVKATYQYNPPPPAYSEVAVAAAAVPQPEPVKVPYPTTNDNNSVYP